jgi:hypothetical protein
MANLALIAHLDRLKTMLEKARNPRAEAQELMEPGFVARVLEPSPPAIHTGEFADDPTDRSDARTGVVSPVSSGDLTWVEWVSTRSNLNEWAIDRWLVPGPRLGPVPDGFSNTRDALHQLAYFVLAPVRHRANTKIGLRFTKNGFGTPFFGHDAQVRIDGVDLVVQRNSEAARTPLTTVNSACQAAEIPYRVDWFLRFGDPLPPLDPDQPLVIDHDSSVSITAIFGFATGLLEELRASAPVGERPSLVQLWPEHFDVAVELGDPEGGGRASFGVSPGDQNHREPYLYVSAWGEIDRANSFWNDPHFNGASLPYGRLLEVDDQRAAAFDFFRLGRDALKR